MYMGHVIMECILSDGDSEREYFVSVISLQWVRQVYGGSVDILMLTLNVYVYTACTVYLRESSLCFVVL